METIREWIEKNRITEVECLIPDITGNARGKIMPAKKFLREGGMRLPEVVFFQTVTGDWPDDESMIDLTEKDMTLEPDQNTIRFVPWTKEPTAQVIHDCYTADGDPVDISPRAVLRRVLSLYEKQGWQPIVAPELEFFLVKKNLDWDYPLEPPIGRNGRPETARQSFSIDAVNEFDPIFEDMYDYCEAQELDVDTLVHESGAAQMELNFDHGEPLDRVDQVFLFKRTMREAALRHDVYATFMAKPMEDEPGSSMHIHQSLVDKNGKNLFSNADGSNSELFLNYIAGMQKYTPAAIAFFAPNVNSYRRLVFGDSAPTNVAWGEDNRTVGLRVPNSDKEARRLENRYAGADANPYLAMALTLACGYLGMKEKLTPTEKSTGDMTTEPYSLPHNLEDALGLLENCDELREILGDRFVSAYVAIKRKEYRTYFQVISSWEREFLLLNV
ncbi:glutamine synthetase family protein [Vibrio breoganii]|uniref:Glutamine synthetase n=1 Tax=Vibrio breoganii TaxID=553239 RepID=A0AAJ3SAZ5_9VIBR|nr:glutamine synthetase family protein [Vibrio breoganii]ANO35061.1 glutamine synthetase [Vibrio breoganii]NMO73171.1 glutamine synthetase [Vibrio breoganii]NMR69565.1 glutamine synthetase [Vibrio breoganii]OED96411.1 glutamine synthetase [Vibrio breoganii ZF-29]OEF87725.1 glutamine synthetase [Vibrio breoganii 1C10]